jgi:hypothetical protein
MRRPENLVIAENEVPGWSAALDGRSVDISRANGMHMSVVVPDTAARVVLEVPPARALAGTSFPVLALALTLVAPARRRGGRGSWKPRRRVSRTRGRWIPGERPSGSGLPAEAREGARGRRGGRGSRPRRAGGGVRGGLVAPGDPASTPTIFSGTWRRGARFAHRRRAPILLLRERSGTVDRSRMAPAGRRRRSPAPPSPPGGAWPRRFEGASRHTPLPGVDPRGRCVIVAAGSRWARAMARSGTPPRDRSPRSSRGGSGARGSWCARRRRACFLALSPFGQGPRGAPRRTSLTGLRRRDTAVWSNVHPVSPSRPRSSPWTPLRAGDLPDRLPACAGRSPLGAALPLVGRTRRAHGSACRCGTLVNPYGWRL